MLDFDEESKRTESEEVAANGKAPDKIDDEYDYEAKYLSDSARFYVPARISEELSEQVRETAVKVYTAMECRGLARVDFFVRRADSAVVFNEINTIPGFTSISMYPKLFAASGIAYPALLDNLISLAMEDEPWYRQQ